MAQKMTDTKKLHIANGIIRIRQAIKNCDLPISNAGSIFSQKLKYNKQLRNNFIDRLNSVTYSDWNKILSHRY